MKQRTFTILNQANERLVCVEALPDNPGKTLLPVVILCHGFDYFKEEDGIFTGIAESLIGLGYAVYYFDFSGCGESEGDYAETSLTKLVDDLRSVYRIIMSYEYVDTGSISLIGQSFGTNVIIAAQVEYIQKIVLCSSFANSKGIISSVMTEFNEKGISYKHHTTRPDTAINPGFWSDLYKYRLDELIANFTCPILFIHGLKDVNVPIENMRELYKKAKHAVEPVILPNSNHGLRPERAMVFDAVANFFVA